MAIEIDTTDPSAATLEMARNIALEAARVVQSMVPEGTPVTDAMSAALLASASTLVAFCRATGADIGEVLRDALKHLGQSYTPNSTVH